MDVYLKENVIKNQIKSILFSIGLKEKYVAFNDLSTIIFLLLNTEINKKIFNENMCIICNTNKISKRTLTQGLNKILNLNLKGNELYNQNSSNLNTIYHKVCMLKNYIEEELKKRI